MRSSWLIHQNFFRVGAVFVDIDELAGEVIGSHASRSDLLRWREYLHHALQPWSGMESLLAIPPGVGGERSTDTGRSRELDTETKFMSV